MEFVQESTPIIIAGLWNNAIFNQEWVAKYLLPGENLKIEYPLNGNGSVRSSTDQLRICTIDNKLVLTTLDSEDSTLIKIENLAVKISDYLPHTPVTAMGFNFNFKTSVTENLTKCNNLADKDTFSENGLSLIKTNITRSFSKDKYVLTLSIEYFEQECIISMNYNFPITSLIEIKSILLEGELLRFKEISLELLENTYGIKFNK